MTNLQRWSNLNESYDERVGFMAQFIQPHSSVLDMGAGALALKKYLPEGCRYQSCDIVKREDSTIVCDFNAGEYPPEENYDVVFCSGVLEYMNDLPAFLRELRKYSDKFIVSYVATCSKSKKRIKKRENLDWVNHYKLYEIVRIFLSEGFLIEKIMDNTTQKIFLLKKMPASRATAGWLDVAKVLWMDFRNRFTKKAAV